LVVVEFEEGGDAVALDTAHRATLFSQIAET
jgi:hypothetical protein